MSDENEPPSNKSLMRVTVRIERNEIKEMDQGHSLRQLRDAFRPWLQTPTLQDEEVVIAVFEGATHAEQLTRDPHGQVRVALVERDGPQPLIPGAYLKLCRPMSGEWKPNHGRANKQDTERNA